ncbi:hypothetical protein IU450_13335 [Nocardia abscessus]|uniref:hypothetical protein n=1 Tax=Nocardia abscessus TaxID=120957 RepID=UPI0018932100|nr:hypothetical protein [Nocardia abscessus]MBF6336864.1 hypothetical protein [Nocardia abscessus]
MNDRTVTTVALVACSGIIGGLIRRGLRARTDVTVVEDAPAHDLPRLSQRLRRLAPDVVVWQLDDDAMLDRQPELFGATGGFPVIAITDDGRDSAVWRLWPHRTALGTPSIDTLVDTIHAVTASAEENPPCQ